MCDHCSHHKHHNETLHKYYEETHHETKCCESKCCDKHIDDCLVKKIECLWKNVYCDAHIVPNHCDVLVLSHTATKCKTKINGLTIKSPLVNNGYYSVEISDCNWVNLYEAVIPDIPGKCGCKSSGELYIDALVKLGLSVDNDNYHWKGTTPGLLFIRSKSIGLHPVDFSKKQIKALECIKHL